MPEAIARRRGGVSLVSIRTPFFEARKEASDTISLSGPWYKRRFGYRFVAHHFDRMLAFVRVFLSCTVTEAPPGVN